MRWQPIIGAAAVAGLLTRTETPPVLVVAVVAMGLSHVLDDPAAVILDATPTGRARRRLPCLGLTLGLTAALWLGVVQPAWSLGSSSPAAGPANLAVATLAAVMLAAGRRSRRRARCARGGHRRLPPPCPVVAARGAGSVSELGDRPHRIGGVGDYRQP